MSSSATRPGASLTVLLKTTSCVAVALACLALIAPLLQVPSSAAKLVATVLAIAALLVTGWAAPLRGAHAGYWLVGLMLCEALLFSLELGPLTPALLCLLAFIVLTTAALVGGYIGALFEFPGMLMVVSYVAALADCLSLIHPQGLTAQALRHPRALALLMLSVPLLGSARIVPVVGIGDVAFVVLYVAGARATGLSPARTLIALGIAMCAVAITVQLLEVSLPALPFLGASVVLVHPEARRLPVAQARRVVANLAVVTLILGGLLWSGARQARQASKQPLPIGAAE